jgi:hypothetical protein
MGGLFANFTQRKKRNMKIAINDHRKIFAVQQEFNKLFPHLRLEFLSKPSKAGAAASAKIMRERSKTLGDCRVVHTKGDLTLSHSMTVADLQQSLSDNYGLSVLVYLKSGNDWIETTGNGKLSMDEQDIKQRTVAS